MALRFGPRLRPQVRHLAGTLVAAAVLAMAGTAAHAAQRIQVGADPRVELVTVMLSLSGAKSGLPVRDTAYATRIRNHFFKHRNAPAVAQLAAMMGRGLTLRDTVTLALRWSAPPALTLPAELPPALVTRAGGRKELDKLTRFVRAFAKATDFDGFFAAEKPWLDKQAARVRDGIGDTDWATLVELYFGSRQAGYHVVVSPLLPSELALPPQATRSGLEVHVALGARDGADEPSWGGTADILDVTLREIVRPFLAPLLSQFEGEIRLFAPLLKDVEPAMARIGVREWPQAFSELVARAVAVRMLAAATPAKGGGVSPDAASARYQKDGFTFVPALAQRLSEYETARKRYPDLQSFFPRVISVLGEIKGGRTPPPKLVAEGHFDGTLIGALGQTARDGVLLVPPAGIKNRPLDARLRRDLEVAAAEVRTRRGGFVGLLDDVHTGERNLAGTVVWLFGTPASALAKRWLAPDATPTFGKKSVTFGGKTYKGKSMQVVQARKGGSDTLAAIVVLAASPGELLGARRCLPPAAAWAVCDGGRVLEQGPPRTP